MLAKIQIRPGFDSQKTQTANESGWFSCNLVRWQNGLLQKLGGWLRLIDDACAGLIRSMHTWEDLSGEKNLLLGTDGGPQLLVDTTLYNLFILQAGFTTNNTTFSVTNGTTLVTVRLASGTIDLLPGDSFITGFTLSIGGRLLQYGTSFTVVGVTTSTFTFDMPLLATQTDTNVGAVGTFTFSSSSVLASVTCRLNCTAGSDQITFTVTAGSAAPVVGQTVTTATPFVLGLLLFPGGQTYTITSVVSPSVFTASNPYGLAFPTTDSVSPVATTVASNVTADVLGTFPNHGYIPGQQVTFVQGTFVRYNSGGFVANYDITANSVITVLTTPTADTYSFSGTAFGSTTGAGSTTVTEGTDQRTTPPTYGNVLLVVDTGPSTPQNWFTDNLGQNGIISWTDSAIYIYTPPINTAQFPALNGAVITNAGAATGTTAATAPQINAGTFTAMPQAQIIAYGTEAIIGGGQQDPLLVRFSDAGSYTEWTATVSNQAGSYRLSRGSAIIGGFQAPQATLLWTDTDLWTMSYIGPPLVYSFNIMGTGCGLVAPKARAAVGRTTFWQGQNCFWMFDGSSVQPLECPVWDIFFNNLDTASIGRCFTAANSSFSEVAFWAPSIGGSGEPDFYVKYHITSGLWDFGGRVSYANSTMIRTAWEDNNIFGPPLGGDGDSRIQQHEMGFDDDDLAMRGVFAETGYADIQDGDDIMFLDRFIPDLKWFGTDGYVAAKLRTVNYPLGPQVNFGPYTMTPTTQFFSLRARARQIALRMEWGAVKGYSARIGAIMFNVRGAGKRP